ncbi:MAG: hypothetical protein ABIU20_02210 [Blastocatellia bacterium]
MDNARRSGLGLVFAIIGFFIGRMYLPATPDKALSFSSFTTRVAPATTPITVAPPILVAPATPGIFAPVTDSNTLPTPYPTPATLPTLNGSPGIRAIPAPAPVQAPIRVPTPVSSRPSSYPTPYPTPRDQSINSTAPPGVLVNRAPAPAPFSLDSFDRQSHVVYLILALLAIGIIYKKRSNDAAVCIAMFIIGFILGHYIDPGPINFSNPFNRAV